MALWQSGDKQLPIPLTTVCMSHELDWWMFQSDFFRCHIVAITASVIVLQFMQMLLRAFENICLKGRIGLPKYITKIPDKI